MNAVEEEGLVTEVSGSQATVVIEHVRTEACGHCTMCQPQPDGTYRLPVVSDQPLEPGDKVVVSIEQPGALALTVVVFLVPTVALVLGLLLGRGISAGWTNQEGAQLFQVAFGLACGALAFSGVYLYDRVLRARRVSRPPKVLRVLARASEDWKESGDNE